jgi:hypothetical protein
MRSISSYLKEQKERIQRMSTNSKVKGILILDKNLKVVQTTFN